jgi:hypothetical protein
MACIPQYYRQGNDTIKAGLILNAAVVASSRKKGLLTRMTDILNAKAQCAGITQMIGLGNQYSTGAYVKYMGYRLERSLPVRIGFFFPSHYTHGELREIPIDDILSQAVTLPLPVGAYEQCWTQALIRWRLNAPHQRYRIFTDGRITLVTTTIAYGPLKLAAILKVWTPETLPRAHTKRLMRALAQAMRTPFLLHAGHHHFFRLPSIRIPRLLLPSPLNFISKQLEPSPEFILDVFELLDCDIY